jgi:archaemetzincin
MRARHLRGLGSLFAVAVLLGGVLAFAAEAPASPERVVAIVPLGRVKQEYLERIAQELQARMNVRVRIDARRELPKAAYYAPRRRWRAERILDWLDETPPEGAWKVIAVTEAELSTTKGKIPDWGIAGLGTIGGRNCVLSAYLYKKHSRRKEALLRRLGDVAVHEFGHTLGFPHCEVKGCVMSDAKGKAIKSADESTGHYCATCLGLLAPEDRALVK